MTKPILGPVPSSFSGWCPRACTLSQKTCDIDMSARDANKYCPQRFHQEVQDRTAPVRRGKTVLPRRARFNLTGCAATCGLKDLQETLDRKLVATQSEHLSKMSQANPWVQSVPCLIHQSSTCQEIVTTLPPVIGK